MSDGDRTGQEAPQFPHQLHTGTAPGESCTATAAGGQLPRRVGVSAAALESVDLPAKRAEALRWVTAHPGRSARELERLSGLRKINARLSELESQGVVEGTGYTTCSVTGMVATAWRPTGNAPRPLPRKVTARQRIQQLEAEVARLRQQLAEALAPRGQLDLPVWAEVRQ